MNREEMLNKLKDLDDKASKILPEGNRIFMTVVGGGALILGGFLSRATTDIDIIDRYDELQALLNKNDVNNRSNAFVDCLAENYQDRLVKLDLETKVIDYYLLSLEDLVIMKLFSDRLKDYVDITSDEVINNLNWDLLDNIITSGEADVSFNQRRYSLFLEKYEKYKKEFKKWDRWHLNHF